MLLETALCLMSSLALVSAPNGTFWLERSDYGHVGIVIGDKASPAEQYGAEQFKEYWLKCTGHDAPIGDSPGNRINVWIGYDSLPPNLRAFINLEGLGTDGLHLKTVENNLIIVGGRQRGAMYGVFEFFDRYMGVRWLAPDCTHIPPPPDSLPEIDFRYVPPIAWRDINYRAFHDPHFAVVHHLNGQFPNLPAKMGGHIAYANGFAHTFHSFVSPAQYGKEHPEYFSEIDGKRRTERSSTQLCLTNPEVLRLVIEKTRDILRKASPDRSIVCITQMDTGYWCECAHCAAIDKREESHSGSVLWFVNQVAEAIEKEFPHAFIDTFAYTYTRKPPKHLRPRNNVIVRLCSIECDFFRPHADRESPQNRIFHQDINAWSKITQNLYIWDYTQNWYCHQQPHPNFHVLQPNIRFFTEHGVKGLFEQASPSSPHSDFEYLKAYLLARAMWNPQVNWQEAMNEFIAIYYQDAGIYIHQYIDLITQKVRDEKFYLAFNAKLDWMDVDTVEKAEAIFQKAFATTKDPVLTERLRSVYLPVQYAALVCPPKIQYTGDAWVLTRPPSLTFDEYWQQIMKMGVTMIGDEPIEKLRERLQGQTPPRYQRLAIEKIENENYEVWVVPELCGAVVRFLDKRTGVDLFRGEESVLKERWRLQDWEVMDPEHPKIEEGISGSYTVVERTPERVAIERKLNNGLTVVRSMTLRSGSNTLEFDFTLANRSDATIIPFVKPHPEFWLQGPNKLELWIERQEGWKREPLNYLDSAQIGGDSFEPTGISRWAAWIPRKHVSIVVTVPKENIKNLFYYYNIQDQHVNLEAVPDLAPLLPGASRTMKVAYAISQTKPSRL